MTAHLSSKVGSRNNTIDFVRFCAILFVIILHVDFESDNYLSGIAHMVSRWAVPFFFIISGYFSGGRDLRITSKKRRDYLIRLAGITLIGDIIYFPYMIFNDYHHLDFQSLIVEFITSGTSFHLWFLHTLLFGQFIISLPPKNNLAVMMAVALGILTPIFNLYPNLYFNNISIGILLSLSQCIPFLALGLLLRKLSITRNVCWIIILLGAILEFFEFMFNVYYGDMNANIQNQLFFGTALLSFGICALLVTSSTSNKVGKPKIKSLDGIWHKFYSLCSKFGKEYVLGIYLIHIYIRILINLAARKLTIYSNFYFKIISPFLILMFSVIFLMALNSIYNKMTQKQMTN